MLAVFWFSVWTFLFEFLWSLEYSGLKVEVAGGVPKTAKTITTH